MQRRVREKLSNSRRLRKLKYLLINIRVRDRRISLLRVLIIFWDKVNTTDLFERAYGVAFNLTLSVFPSVIFFFATLAYLPFIDDAQALEFLHELLPPSIYRVASATILDILSRPRGGLVSFGVMFALFLATSGMLSLMSAFNRIHQTRENRTYLKSRSVATVLTIILLVVLLIAIVLLIVGQVLINWVYHQNSLMEPLVFYLVITLRFLIMYVAFYLGISSIYYLGPSIHQRWHFFSPGSQVATLLCLAVSFLFSAYISNFGTYNKLYGSIGALIALMVWLYMISVILLIGYTINASIDVALERLGIKPARAAKMHIERVELGHIANAPDEGTK